MSVRKKQSAGILLYRMTDKKLEVFLVHPGGPFWKNKDIGAWTIPKGEFDGNETAMDAAVREFREETGHFLPGPFYPLAPIRQKGGKQVTAEQIDTARTRGATDLEIHDTVLIAASFCMFNRYVDGLGTWAPRDRQFYVDRAPGRAEEGYQSSVYK